MFEVDAATFLQHPFFAFLLQDDFSPPYLFVLSKLNELSLLLLHEDFDFEQAAFTDLEQDLFLSPLQQVPFFFFSQVELQTLPVSLQVLTFFTSSISIKVSLVKTVCAFILVIPKKNTANSKIDIFFFFVVFIYSYANIVKYFSYLFSSK